MDVSDTHIEASSPLNPTADRAEKSNVPNADPISVTRADPVEPAALLRCKELIMFREYDKDEVELLTACPAVMTPRLVCPTPSTLRATADVSEPQTDASHPLP
jgi:hypothetical protein